MDDSTKLMVTRRDLVDARKEASRRHNWESFWIAVVAIACGVGISVVLVWLIG